ncbi:MAG: GDSL-like Lipase/Acylhydrolase family protein [Pseudonocardia sp.]|nr:GDSL-like Lipase/Acylhydrolase family protein [Pseudonocardia sp.]
MSSPPVPGSSATAIELDTLRTRVGYRDMPPRPDGVYDQGLGGGRVLLADVDAPHGSSDSFRGLRREVQFRRVEVAGGVFGQGR